MMMLKNTLFWSGLFGFFYFWLTLRVVRYRKSKKISLGDGSDSEMRKIISAHSNFSQFVPFALILLALVESINFFHASVIHITCLMIFIGRILHYQGIIRDNYSIRPLGMKLTLVPIFFLSVFAVIQIFL